MNESLEVALTPGDPKYWLLWTIATVWGAALLLIFAKAKKENKDKYLKRLGFVLIVIHLYVPIMLWLDPDRAFSVHRNLPFHFCSVNFWLLIFNCFLRSRKLFVFSAYMAIMGGLHSFLTPLFTEGMAWPIFINFALVHGGLIIIPFIMMKHFRMRFYKWDWVRAYLFDVSLSMAMMLINYLLNTYVPNVGVDPANYMYVNEAPLVDNPFLWRSLGWPGYLIPIHFVFIAHMLVFNLVLKPMGFLVDKPAPANP